MKNGPPPNPPAEDDVYLIFCAAIDGLSAERIASNLSTAINRKAKRVHLAMQTAGGVPADGVFLYNLFRAAPVDLTIYNIGTIASAGVLAYLGAKHRKASALATFMTHRTTGPMLAANADQLKALTQSVALDDARTEAILKAHLKLTEDLWANLWRHDLHWSAKDAQTIGLVDAIADFAPPFGSQIYAI